MLITIFFAIEIFDDKITILLLLLVSKTQLHETLADDWKRCRKRTERLVRLFCTWPSLIPVTGTKEG